MLRSSLLILMLAPSVAWAADAPLVVAAGGKTTATVVVAPSAGPWEKQAAAELVRCIEVMTGAKPALAEAPSGQGPQLIVGSAALQADPSLAAALAQVGKKQPVLRGDAIVLRRKGQQVLLAGTNDDSHYYAVAELLRRWGCRWYLPTAIGECLPEVSELTIGDLDYAYAPPFEVRKYWVAWNGSGEGQREFQRRNFMNYDVDVPSGHAIGEYVKELIPKGKTLFDIPIAEDATADHIAAKVAGKFAKGEQFSLGMEDGIYRSDSKLDKELQAGLFDKYFLVPVLTDPFLTLYNKVCERLLKQHPESQARIGFLAYSNLTIPPQRKITAAKPLVAYLAAIDIDPIHGMDDPKSPPRHEYKEMMKRWAEVMEGRVVIYDYDQGMLVWRDIPNPSVRAVAQDYKHYRDAGILGVSTESRNAIATVFLNLYVRAQLAWNPDAELEPMLAEFYETFYGPAAKPMAAYWTAILDAWDKSIITEHEHFVIPAIYTPELVSTLRTHLTAAEQAVEALKASSGRNDKLYVERVQFARLSFEVLDAYTAMVRAAATEGDYAAAVAAGERGLAARLELAKANPTFTTRVVGVAAENDKSGAAWWPGEVQQYRDLLTYTNGSKGKLITKLPLEWAFRRDPHDTGLASHWARQPSIDLSWWKEQKDAGSIASHQRNPGHWEMLRTDLYMQAQGVISPDYHSYTGHAWYRTDVDVPESAANGPVRLRFPGLFNECWLYVNGYMVGHREQRAMWWYNDYKFEWDVDLTGHLKPGKNTVTLRLHNPHHFGGIFRRPFLYQPIGN